MVADNLEYMESALLLARKAAEHDDIPVGCVIVLNNEIIAQSENRVEVDSDSTAHAEMLAIREAQKKVGYKHLLECDMYVTLEPCAMCAGAIVLSRIRKIYIATADPKTGACGSIMNIANNSQLNHRCEIDTGILQVEASTLIKEF